MKPVVYCRIAATIFGVVALAHAARVVLHIRAQVADLEIPVWISAVGVAVAGTLAVLGCAAARRG